MSLKEDLYLPLFKRLESLECSQKKIKYFSDELLHKLKKSAGNVLQDYKQENLDKKKIFLPIENESKVKICSHNSANLGECHFIVNESHKTNFELSDFKQNSNKVFRSHNQDNKCNKYAYLKKGKGISRYNYKKFKGFKKRQSDHFRASKSKHPVKVEKIKKISIHEESQIEKRSNFEKLEELTKSESFCSTSSTVLGLLQESISSHSNSISSRLSFNNSSINSVTNTSRNYCRHLSPIRKLFSCKGTEMCPYNDTMPLLSSKRCISGILKKSDGSNSLTPMFSPKVKFLERGVKVLEYEYDENQTDCSNDTDLLSSSDLENLALINFRINLKQEDSSSNYFTDKNNLAFKIGEDSQVISESNLRSPFLYRTKFDIDNKQEMPHISQICYKESLEIKSHKILMLAKINELIKEIDIFKRKNKYLEDLIDTEEKKRLDHDKIISFTPKICISNYELKNSRLNSRENTQLNKISMQMQIQKLKEKLISLEKENIFLKKKDLQSEMYKIIDKKKRQKYSLSKQSSVSFRLQNKNINIAFKNKAKSPTQKHYIAPVLKNLTNNTKNPASAIEKKKILYEKQGINSLVTAKTIENKPVYTHELLSSEENSNFCTSNELPSKYPASSKENWKIIDKYNRMVHDYVSDSEKNINNLIISSKKIERYPCNDNKSQECTCENNCMHVSNTPLSQLSERYSSGDENCKATDRYSVLEDVPEKCMIYVNSSEKSYLFPVVEKEFPSHVQSLKTISEIYNTLSLTENLNLNKILRKKLIKENSCIEPIDFSDVVKVNDNAEHALQKIHRDIYRILTYSNGDKEIIYSDKKVYHYSVNKSTRTTFSNEKKEEIKFANGQKEIYFADGTFELTFPDFSSKTEYSDGTKVLVYHDGAKIYVNCDKTKIIHFPNGQKEIHKGDSTSRIYPDGTSKIIYKDGREETRYLGGKIRFKPSNDKIFLQKD